VLKHADRNYYLDPKERSMLEGFKAQDPKGATSNVMANMPVDFLCKPEYETPLLKKLNSSLSLAEKCARRLLISWRTNGGGRLSTFYGAP
uniref:hypothetical protein n=1 Tax=Pseudomonas viridiflava TaxID=33069 RepID=UPI00197D6403